MPCNGMTAQDLIDFLSEGDTSRPINFFYGEGGLKDDQRQGFTYDDIDDEMSEVIDINIPEIKA
jgi:hypothetical protein